MNKKFSTFLISLLLCALVGSPLLAKVGIRQTNVPVIDSGKALYSKDYTGGPVRLIEVDSSGTIEIDNGAVGTSIIGTLTVDGVLTVDSFIELDPSTVTDTSATTDATITPVSSYMIIDTHNDVAISTVNAVTTANIAIGSLIYFNTNVASQDVVFIETGNIDLGGTRTLSDPLDVLVIQKVGADSFREITYTDNN